MIRTLSTLFIFAALAGPVSAGEVRVSLAGKDDAAVRSDVNRAAEKVCTEAYTGVRGELHEWAACIDDATAEAMAQVKAARQAAAEAPPPTSSTNFAALSPSSAERR
jgi:hypothetical protein